MKMIYLSHPYTGNEEENRAEAERIMAMLAGEFPNVLFINPLAVMAHMTQINASYETVMGYCLELLYRCDGVIMCGDWRNSRGCMIEREAMLKAWMPVWESVDEFSEAMKKLEGANE